MSGYHHRGSGRVGYPASDNWDRGTAPGRPDDRPTAWASWIWFAGIMMIMIGMFNAIEGLVALFKSNYYVAGPKNLLVLDLTGWGWLHLIVGIVVGLTGVMLFTGAVWARWVTVVLAVLNAVAQLVFMAVYPVWSVIVIALCVIVIWAIVAHGDESTLDG